MLGSIFPADAPELGDDPPLLPPSGPFTSLEGLDRLAAAGGRVFRVKAVVSDMKGCKIRKKKYLVRSCGSGVVCATAARGEARGGHAAVFEHNTAKEACLFRNDGAVCSSLSSPLTRGGRTTEGGTRTRGFRVDASGSHRCGKREGARDTCSVSSTRRSAS